MALKIACTLFLILQVLHSGRAQDRSFTLESLSDWTENGPWSPAVDSVGSCFYSNYAMDFNFAWGCGGPEQNPPGTTLGYWSACKAPSCQVSFYLDGFMPGSVLVKGLVGGDALISISVKFDPNDPKSYLVYDVTSAEGNVGQFQGELDIDLSGFQDAKVVEVQIHSPKRAGYALLDKIVVRETPVVEPPSLNEASTKISSLVYILLFMGLAQFIKY